MSLVNAMLDEADGSKRWELVRSLVERALAGEPAALKILWDRTDPTSQNALTINNNMPNGSNEVLELLDKLKASVVNGKGKKR